MFISVTQVRRALKGLATLHPFFGITYLVFKKAKLPVGETTSIPINTMEQEFLSEFNRLDPRSQYFFTPFRTSSRAERWLSPKYPSSGSQKTRTQGDLARAFIHPKDSDVWGWRPDYLNVLEAKLRRDKVERIPAFWLAVWLYRTRSWDDVSPVELISTLLEEFNINDEERRRLFDPTPPADDAPLLDTTQATLEAIADYAGRPPDALPEEGGTLRLLELYGIGPSKKLSFEPADRLSLITGDNGLGKTFVLECAWWALTGAWAERPAYPRFDAKRTETSISFQIAGKIGEAPRAVIGYDWAKNSWTAPQDRPTLPGLIVYARVDGSFAVWDPIRKAQSTDASEQPGVFLFRPEDVIRGLEGRIEGILRDWVSWQRSPSQDLFQTFRKVLEKISPPDMSPLTPGEPRRVAGETKDIPTLAHPYGDVPFLFESAGVRRIVTIAYLLVWSWYEHKALADMARRQPQTKIVILIDEIEAHLHPKWQRVVLPAILEVTSILSVEVEPQVIATTHSPLVLASLETNFLEGTDKLFHLQLSGDGDVSFTETEFMRKGTVDAWLTSEIFELKEARSTDAESVMERARLLMRKPHPTMAEIQDTHKELEAALASSDEFWPRWLFFAGKRGAQLD